MTNKHFDLFKIIFVWSAIIFGIIGAALRFDWLIIIAAFMIAVAIIYVRYFTMKERLDKRKGEQKQ